MASIIFQTKAHDGEKHKQFPTFFIDIVGHEG